MASQTNPGSESFPLGTEDTDAESHRYLDARLRDMTAGEKILRTFALSAVLRRFTLAGIKADFPEASEREVRRHFVLRLYGEEIARQFDVWEPK